MAPGGRCWGLLHSAKAPGLQAQRSLSYHLGPEQPPSDPIQLKRCCDQRILDRRACLTSSLRPIPVEYG